MAKRRSVCAAAIIAFNEQKDFNYPYMEEKRRFHHTPALDDMALFVAVVRHGSFHAASDALAMPGPYEKHRLLALELEPGALDGAHGVIRAAGRRIKTDRIGAAA